MFAIRTSIAGLMLGVVFVAVAIAALVHPTPLWASCLFMAAVTLMATAVLGVIADRQRARMTWAGMAIFGWVYLGIVFGPWTTGNATTIPALPTMLAYETVLQNRMIPPTRSADGTPPVLSIAESEIVTSYDQITISKFDGAEFLIDGPNPTMPGNGLMQRILRDMMNLRRVVHSLGAIAFAIGGGLIGKFLDSRRFMVGT